MGMITKNIGKNTIGDGKKMTVELKSIEDLHMI